MVIKPEFIVFLAFDGVTHPIPGFVPNSLEEFKQYETYDDGPFFCKQNVIAVNYLVHKLKADIIITSTWRLKYDWKLFNKLFMGRIIGTVPSEEYGGRWSEIKAYQEFNQCEDTPYLIVDDDGEQFPSFANTLITDGNGLTLKQVKQFFN